uniref:Uncharacterized protein n=1 Tax=Rhizophora mucronata TaxID=61149 RepID=A0A2P2KXD0_RHIMU
MDSASRPSIPAINTLNSFKPGLAYFRKIRKYPTKKKHPTWNFYAFLSKQTNRIADCYLKQGYSMQGRIK